jgi:hypothetical protein
MAITTASITTPPPIITTTAPSLIPATIAQGASAISSPTAVTNNPSSHCHNGDEDSHRELLRTKSVVDLSNHVKPADNDRV